MIDKVIETLSKNFDKKIKEIKSINDNEVYLIVSAYDAVEICSFIYTNLDCSLISMFANDEREQKVGMCVYYAFGVRKLGSILTVKAVLEEGINGMESVTSGIPAANLYEREIKDLFGIDFKGNPDDRELVFHQNWPDGLHPLKKDFNVNKKPAFVKKDQDFVKIEGTGVFEVPVGPVHAGIIEPGHFRFSVAGEPIINLEAKLYFVHKGTEKLSENQNFEKVLYISERISGDESFSNSLAYCQAIEKIAVLGVIPERAGYSRTILGEMERLYNHLGDIGGICVDVAYIFAAGQFSMMRLWCQALNEEVTGSRFLRSTNKPGGLRKDFISGKEKVILNSLNALEKEFNETVDMIKSNSLFIDRVENTGILSKVTAVDLNAVGPAGRAAGIRSDVRSDFPYAAYGKVELQIPEHNNGDVNCRMNVKIQEVNESIKIIRKAINEMPAEGGILEPVTKLDPFRYAFGMTESPRGENCHWVMAGENNTIYRYKIRTPSFCNWPALCHAVKGNVIPDFPLINKSFNLSYSGNDL